MRPVKIGGQAVFGLEIVKTVTQPLADIYKGVRMQWSDPATPNRSMSAPHRRRRGRRRAWRCIPTAGVSQRAVAEHHLPGHRRRADAVRLRQLQGARARSASRSTRSGDLYSDNSASDAEFGGRIFSFGALDGARNIAGTVNYYSQLITFANPVSVQALTSATASSAKSCSSPTPPTSGSRR